MALYYILIVLTFAGAIFDFVKDRNIQLLAYLSICIVLVAFAGFRTIGVDNDGVAYADVLRLVEGIAWRDLLTGNYPETMERGYLLFNKMVGVFGGNARVVFILMAILTGMINYKLFFKYSPMPFFSVLIYLCFFYFYRDFTQMRFALTAAIGLAAILHYADGRYWSCFASLFLAVFIHGAVLIVPVLVMAYLVLRNYWFYFFLPFLGFIGGLMDPVILLFRLGGLPPTLAGYVEQSEFGRGGYMISIIAQVFMFALFAYRERLCAYFSERKIDLFFIALSLGSFINLLFISFAIMQRLSLVLFSVIVFVMPYVFVTIEDDVEDRNIGLLLRFTFMAFVLYYGMNMISDTLLQPYSIF